MLNTVDDKDFDLIYSVDVFEHIWVDQMPFADAFNRLKTGGYLLVKMPNKDITAIFPHKWFDEFNKWEQAEHVGQVYTLADLKARFEKEGFKVVFAEQTDGIWTRLAWELHYLFKKRGKIPQLMILPFCKLLVNFDYAIHPKGTSKGNAITVIGQKI